MDDEVEELRGWALRCDGQALSTTQEQQNGLPVSPPERIV
jgi:hypothetical protein